MRNHLVVQTSWLLETDVFHENLKLLVAEIKRQGMRVEMACYHRTDHYLSLFHQDDCVVFYGSLNFAEIVRREAPWIPGVYYNKTAYDCSRYYPDLAQYSLLNADYVMLPYDDIIRRKDFLLNAVGEQGCVFIRPCSGSKLFTGTLICAETFDKDVGYLSNYGTSSSDMCIIAPPKNVEAEWRFIVVEDCVITGSQYRANNKTDVQPTYPIEALALAKKVAASGYAPDTAWCIDICRTTVGNYYLLEIGCFSCAGLYACDLEIVVREVSAAALRDWQQVNTPCP
jgi:hypothetical protein